MTVQRAHPIIHFCLKTLKSVNPGNFSPVDTRKQKQDGFVRYLSRKEEKKGKGKLSCSNTN